MTLLLVKTLPPNRETCRAQRLHYTPHSVALTDNDWTTMCEDDFRHSSWFSVNALGDISCCCSSQTPWVPPCPLHAPHSFPIPLPFHFFFPSVFPSEWFWERGLGIKLPSYNLSFYYFSTYLSHYISQLCKFKGFFRRGLARSKVCRIG